MSSIFMCHSSVDKPFVEKLAKDLKRLGLNVWYDGWEIKVGDSITWKIEKGIHENEFLGVILSQDALESEWVKSELSSAWAKQMKLKKVVVLPVLYRDCDIPLFLADKRYADFRSDYQKGLTELAGVFGIKEIEVISEDNWRRFTTKKTPKWKEFRKFEFERLVTVLVDRAIDYNWSTWVGGTKKPLSITLHASAGQNKQQSVSLHLDGKTHAYKVCVNDVYNPNNLRSSDFTIYLGNSINECEEYVWRYMEDFKAKYGVPKGKAYHQIQKFVGEKGRVDLALNLIKDLRWYKGQKL